MNAGGFMHHHDLETYERSLRNVAAQFGSSLRVAEIGTWSGHTSRSANAVLLDAGAGGYEHWCIDKAVAENGVWEPPFPGARCIWKDSVDAAPDVPDGLGLLLIDGCHCYQHVMSDWKLYTPKVLQGGLVLLHDFNEQSQGVSYQYHGPKDSPDSYISVRRALHDLGVTRGHPGWDVAAIGGDGSTWWGQFIVMRKL